ncbi:MAG: hypothetical protein IPG61_07510 [bacterium]|nr:hypothetical protein [bacterium]
MSRSPDHCRSNRALLPTLVVVLVAIVVAMGACVSEMPDPTPLAEVGVLEGRVSEAGVPVPARLMLRNLVGGIEVFADIDADSSGWYRLELPIGIYRASLRLGNSGSVESDLDTVSVGRAVRRKDFVRGRARVSVTLPPAFDGEEARLQIASPYCDAYRYVEVVDGEATFEFRLLPPATYGMILYARSGRDAVFLPGTVNAADADSLHVASDSVSYSVDLRPGHITVSGNVSGSWQLGRQAMRVRAVTPFGATRSEVDCEPDGSFRIDLFAAEQLRFSARCNGVEQWFGGTSFQGATVYNVQPGDHVTGLELSEGGLRISTVGPGLLVDDRVDFLLVHPDGRRRWFATDQWRPSQISNLEAGTYRLYISGFCSADPWLPQWYDDAATESEAMPLTVVNGAFTDVNLVLRPGGALVGTLVEEDGDAGYIGSIFVQDQAGQDICGSSGHATTGAFSVDGLPDGSYYLRASFSGDNWWYPGTGDFSQAILLTVADSDTIGNLVWTVPETDDGGWFP